MSLKLNDEPRPVSNSANWFTTLYFFWIGGMSGASGAVYNSITNCFSYFEAKFPDNKVTFLFPIGPYVANVILITVITYLSTFFSYSKRMTISLVVSMGFQLILPVEAELFPDSTFGIVFMMCLLVVTGFFSNMGYASICGLTSQLGSDFTTYFLIGAAFFSLLQHLVRIALLLVWEPPTDGDFMSNYIYFILMFLIISAGLVLHLIFIRTNFYKEQCESMTHLDDSIKESLAQSSSITVRPKRNLKALFSVFKEVKTLILLMFIICLQHGMFYPGVALMKGVPGLSSYWKNETIVTTFGVFYIIGKKIGQYRRRYGIRSVIIVIMIRFLIDAAFVLEIVEPNLPILRTVWFTYLNVAIFSMSFGFLLVALFIMIPEQFAVENKELSGFVAVIASNIGTMIGTFAALPLSNLHS